ncbi:MAG: Ribosomal RNA small subunit methyltransferase H [candidate division WS6 bacterium OLB20]|uniref:Ribosomal RNA small subunit methyltransferase H n=1 Tax=candidate division WS6 bacterium OLB20 TaxID=1617426 RepID=A0A136M0H6_9BACT|nr:MAG: Ribosomal RNA small subunit methyltransferase H [candidate division WS6 bacterium OLB20]
MSTDQLRSNKGFSFRGEELLDMRMSPETAVTAADLLNVLFKKELEQLFTNYADIDYANRLANAIIRFRRVRPVQTAADLREIIATVVPEGNRSSSARLPEARVFQALRIAVNDEFGALKDFLQAAYGHLKDDGVLAVITFHSGEDRVVKQFIKTHKPETALFRPDTDEQASNPQSRSAKLRIIIKKRITAHEHQEINN